jgi:hypothetical protein
VTQSNFSCRYCKYYDFVGHRGGECQRLGASVQGAWAACTLMVLNISPTTVNPTTRTVHKPALSESQGSPLAYLRAVSNVRLDLPPEELASA